MMTPISHVVIVGGGSAGWLTAACLSSNVNVQVTIIDKEIGNPIGVGEGTLLNFSDFLMDCGLPITDWYDKISANFKTGVLFPDWGYKGNEIWHPFVMNYFVHGPITKYDLWSNHQELDFKRYGTSIYDLSVKEGKFFGGLRQAFHIDCRKLVPCLQDALRHKVKFVQSPVAKVNRDKQGNVKSLDLRNGEEVKGELYVDCSGLLGLLSKEPKRNDLKNRLICDIAIAGHIPEEDSRCYTTCTAKEGGWVWEIPTQNKLGTGYVFNKSLLNIDDAMLQLSEHHNGKIKPEDMQILDWENGHYNENFWHKNVVSIGMSAGFIEPLEATGIALIELGVRRMIELITDRQYNETDIEIYNAVMKQAFESCVDFVGSHYTATQRKEPFWQEAQSHIEISDKQRYYMQILERPDAGISTYRNEYSLFADQNWHTWLIQQGHDVGVKNIPLDHEQSRHMLNWGYGGLEEHQAIKPEDYVEKYIRQN
jgi:tryptophan halogenase